METYKMLSGLHRHGNGGEEEFELIGDEEEKDGDNQ